MHIADALDTPMVVLFSGTELESQWAPRRARTRLLRRPTDCSPCHAFACPFEMQCLDISPEAVVGAAMRALGANERSHSEAAAAAT
jgi:ADP-heptose:LPS heptosyltransferase